MEHNKKVYSREYMKKRYHEDEEFRQYCLNRNKKTYDKKTVNCIKCNSRTNKDKIDNIESLNILTFVCHLCQTNPDGVPKRKIGRPKKIVVEQSPSN